MCRTDMPEVNIYIYRGIYGNIRINTDIPGQIRIKIPFIFYMYLVCLKKVGSEDGA